MTQLPNSLEARDVAVQLHSYADARKQEETGSLVIDKGEGIYVTDINGKRYMGSYEKEDMMKFIDDLLAAGDKKEAAPAKKEDAKK